MTVELTRMEAELLIAILTFAEGAALVESREISAALVDLRPWRSALLRTYLQTVGEALAVDAVARAAAKGHR